MTFQALPYPKSGAMTAAMRAVPPVAVELRVALVQAGRIAVEKRVAKSGEVTVGGGERATLVTTGPRRTLIARHAEGETGFAVVGGVSAGRVQQAGETTDLASLSSGTMLPLVPGARGRLVVDGAVVLFDFAPARARTRPALPAAVRKGLFGDVDWPFTSWVTAALIAVFGFVAASEAADPPIANDVDASLVALAHMVVEAPDPPPPAALASNVSDDRPDQTPSTHATPGPTHGESHRPTRPSHDAPPSLTPEQVADQASRTANILLATALGGHDSGIDAMVHGAPTTSQQEIMAQVDGAEIAQNGAQVLHTRQETGGSGESHDLGTLARHGVTTQADEGHGPTEVVLHTVVRFDPPDVPTVPDVATEALTARVMRAVRGRIPAIRACYEHHLSQAPTAAGKVVESFTVESFGGLSHVTNETNTADDGTEACVRNGLTSLRVQVEPGEGPADFQFPFVFAPQS